MSRSPEVEDALKFRAHSWASEALAAEVERLEAELSQANVAAKAGMYAHDERTFLAECAEKQEQRAETAEARVAELEAALKYEREYVGPSKDHTCESWRMLAQERAGAISRLEAQNARLRAALERLDALYISEFDHEDRPPRPQWLKAALNGEEASK